MPAVRALLFDGHFGFSLSLLLNICGNILANPVSVFLDFHVRLDGFADKFLEADSLFAGGTHYFDMESIQVNEAAAFWAEI